MNQEINLTIFLMFFFPFSPMAQLYPSDSNVILSQRLCFVREGCFSKVRTYNDFPFCYRCTDGVGERESFVEPYYLPYRVDLRTLYQDTLFRYYPSCFAKNKESYQSYHSENYFSSNDTLFCNDVDDGIDGFLEELCSPSNLLSLPLEAKHTAILNNYNRVYCHNRLNPQKALHYHLFEADFNFFCAEKKNAHVLDLESETLLREKECTICYIVGLANIKPLNTVDLKKKH